MDRHYRILARIVAAVCLIGAGPASLADQTAQRPAAGRSAEPDEFRAVCRAQPVFEDTFFETDVSRQWAAVIRPAGPNPNKELQAYRPQNIRAGEGSLRLWATKEANGDIGSGRISSRTQFRYGCFEVVARMPAGKGLWPAIWLRTDFNQPINGEIDMMEGFGSHPGVIQSTIHHWLDGKHLGATCTRLGPVVDSAFGITRSCSWTPQVWSADFTSYHRYGMIWQPHGVTWYLDGARYLQTSDFVPDRAMAIHLNLAVGGVFDGAPDPSTHFPAAMEIKSVRAWALLP
jgi:beta-glucanase (GH16 family)